MFCTNCGQEIPDGSKFCTKCGQNLAGAQTAPHMTAPQDAPQAAPSPATPAEEPAPAPRKKGNPAKIIVPVVAVAVVAAGAFALVKSHKPTVKLQDYVTIEVEGYNGYGKASCTFDTEAFDEKYDDTLHFSADRLRKVAENETYADSGLDIPAGDYDDLAAALEEQDLSSLIFSADDCELTPEEGLSNGDTVTLSWKLTEDEINFVGDLLNCKFEAEDVTMTVDGLEEVGSFDAFDGVELKFSGTAPDGTAQVTSKGKDEACRDLTYTVEPDMDLSNGDKVTVTIAHMDDSSWANQFAEKYGKLPSETSKEYTVEGLPSYASAVSEIPAEALEQMQAQADEALAKFLEENIYSEGEDLIRTAYVGNYLLTAKADANVYEQNQLYLVYKIRVHNQYSEYDYNVLNDFYWYCRFNNLLITEEGECSFDLSDYETSTSRIEFGNDVKEEIFFYYGYKTLDDLNDDVVTKNIDSYTAENNIEDVDFGDTNAETSEDVVADALYQYEADLINDCSEDYPDYEAALKFRAGNGDPNGYAKFVLDGKYDTLTFTAIPVQDTISGDSTTIYITNDENGASIQTITVGKKDVPKAYTVDVSGVNYLNICVNNGGSLGYCVLADLKVSAASGDSLPLEYSKVKAAKGPALDISDDAVALVLMKPYAKDRYSTPAPTMVRTADYLYIWNNTIAVNPMSNAYAKVVYELDGQYDTLTFALSPATSKDFDDNGLVNFTISNEETGEVLDTRKVTKSTPITDVTVNVSGVNYLTIQAECESSTLYNKILLYHAYVDVKAE